MISELSFLSRFVLKLGPQDSDAESTKLSLFACFYGKLFLSPTNSVTMVTWETGWRYHGIGRPRRVQAPEYGEDLGTEMLHLPGLQTLELWGGRGGGRGREGGRVTAHIRSYNLRNDWNRRKNYDNIYNRVCNDVVIL